MHAGMPESGMAASYGEVCIQAFISKVETLPWQKW